MDIQYKHDFKTNIKVDVNGFYFKNLELSKDKKYFLLTIANQKAIVCDGHFVCDLGSEFAKENFVIS